MTCPARGRKRGLTAAMVSFLPGVVSAHGKRPVKRHTNLPKLNAILVASAAGSSVKYDHVKLRFLSTNLLPQRRRDLFIGMACAIAIVIGANAAILRQLHESALRDTQTNLLRQSLTFSELVGRTFQSVDLVLESVVEKLRPDIRSESDLPRLKGEEYYAFLKEQMSGLPQIDTLGIVDADGMRLNHSRDWPSPNIDLSHRVYFQTLKKDPALTSFIDGPIRGSTSGAWVVVLARPVVGKEGRLLAVVFAATNMEYYEKLFGATSLVGEGYAAALVRRDGILLARYPRSAQVGMTVPLTVLPRVQSARSGVSRAISPIDQQARIVAAYRLLGYPLVVIAAQTEAAAFAAWRNIAVMVGVITVAMIGGIVAVGCLIARSWKQQERLDAARSEAADAAKTRALAEAELNRQRDLAEQNMRFNAAVENMSQGLCMFDQNARLVVCNDLYAKMYGLPSHLLARGTAYGDIVAHVMRAGVRECRCEDRAARNGLSIPPPPAASGPSSWVDELADGKLIRVVRQPMRGGGWVETHDDITEQRRAERRLDETKRFLDSIIENIPIAVVVKDAKTRRFVLVNRAFEEMIGRRESELLGQTVFDVFGAKDATFIDEADVESSTNSGGAIYKEYEVEMPMDGPRVHGTNRIVLRDAEGDPKYLIAVIDDITERRRTEQRIAFMAHHDALTGLANRATVAQKIEEAAARQRRRGEPFTVLLMDLDRFKYVNDTLGHSAGDALLREAAARLAAAIRETDVLARLGGDEFAIIQAGERDQREAAGRLASRIIEIIGRPFMIGGHEVNIGTSIGIAVAPEQGTDPDSLLKMADMALYRAKSAGRNGYRFFDPDMGAAANERHALENDLRRAIQLNELELHYQPIVDTRSLRICGAEALVRWRHPVKGLIYPDKFIPLAEDTGMIAQIDAWVLNRACADAARWPASVKVAVNLSPVQFRTTNLSDVVMSALVQSGLPPERLELEITETALIESASECLPALHRFKQAGVAIALDDFGTGYSSLSQLTMFPFDKIKIDKSFTQNLTKRAECAAIISAVLTLAQNLSIATTAEGVETEDQHQLLRLAGVTSLQGYLFKRPCPLVEIDFDEAFSGQLFAGAA